MTYRETILRRVRDQRLLHDVTLELTYRCNLACYYCYNDRSKPGTPLSLAQYQTLLEDLARMQTLYLTLTGGEPMIHAHFFDIGRKARDLGFVVRVRTNGHDLGPGEVRRLLKEIDPYVVEVSLHGATAEVHDRQTRVPGSFERLVGNIRAARASGLRLGVVTTPTAWNQHQIRAMVALCDSLDVPLRFQGPMAPRDNGDSEPLSIQPAAAAWDQIAEIVAEMRTERAADPAMRISGGVTAKIEHEEPAATCSVGVAGVDIDPFGNVQACMHLQESAGNLHEQAIEEIWNRAPLFQRAWKRAVAAAERFTDQPPRQLGAPLFCIAVEANTLKGCKGCQGSCG